MLLIIARSKKTTTEARFSAELQASGAGIPDELLGELLECACSGVMACSTCHVHVDAEWMVAVGSASEEEEDMLDLAYDRRDTSRLGCQLMLRPELDGLRLSLPAGANNMFDHIPFQDGGAGTGRASRRDES